MLVGESCQTKIWLERAYRILNLAMQKYCRDWEGDGKELPGGMRDVALAFGRLGVV